MFFVGGDVLKMRRAQATDSHKRTWIEFVGYWWDSTMSRESNFALVRSIFHSLSFSLSLGAFPLTHEHQ